jgi:hypothetical protein
LYYIGKCFHCVSHRIHLYDLTYLCRFMIILNDQSNGVARLDIIVAQGFVIVELFPGKYKHLCKNGYPRFFLENLFDGLNRGGRVQLIYSGCSRYALNDDLHMPYLSIYLYPNICICRVIYGI